MLVTLAITVGVLVFATFILLALFRSITPAIVIADYKPCAGGWHEAYLNQCQPTLVKIPQQPVNTYSNLAYPATGVFIAWLLQAPPSAVFGFTMIYLFVGSALYHALSTRWAGMLDVTAIFATFSATAMYGLGVLLGIPLWLTTLLMFAVGGLAAYVLYPTYRRNAYFIIGIFLGVTYVLLLINMWLSGNWSAWPYLVASIVAYAIAFIIWNLDKAQTFPVKGWGHGFWHVLSGAATGLVFYAIHLTP